jgi:hypothetical protein
VDFGRKIFSVSRAHPMALEKEGRPIQYNEKQRYVEYCDHCDMIRVGN